MPGLMTEASREDIRQAEERVKQQLESRAQSQISGIGGAGEVHVRDILPSEDLDADDSNNVNGWTDTNREWIQSGLTADQLNQVYEVDSSNRMENKVIAFFAISSVASEPITTEIVFEDGTGSRFERLMFQEAETFTEGDIALMRNPIVFNEGKDGIIHLWPNDSGTERLILHGLVAEKAGTTLGTRSQTDTGSATGVARRPQ